MLTGTHRSIIALAAVTLIVGCDSSLEPGRDSLHWNAIIAGAEGYESVSGSASVVADVETFELDVQLAGLAADMYEWQLATGTCAEPGGRIGAASGYPPFTPETSGTVTISTNLPAILAAAAPYHVSIHVMATDEDDVPRRVTVACGDLIRG
jgi:hypothetical protein